MSVLKCFSSWTFQQIVTRQALTLSSQKLEQATGGGGNLNASHQATLHYKGYQISGGLVVINLQAGSKTKRWYIHYIPDSYNYTDI